MVKKGRNISVQSLTLLTFTSKSLLLSEFYCDKSCVDRAPLHWEVKALVKGWLDTSSDQTCLLGLHYLHVLRQQNLQLEMGH